MKIRLHNDDWGVETNCFVCEPTNAHGLRIPFLQRHNRFESPAGPIAGRDRRYVND